jgi:hypothetical protein
LKRRIKRFRVFKLFNKNGSLFKLFKDLSFDQMTSHYGINKTNRVVGFTPDYIGPSVSVLVDKKNFVVEFLNNNISLLKNSLTSCCYSDLLSSSNSERVVYSAGFDTCGAHLREYFKDNTTSEAWTVKNILRILNIQNFKWFKAAVCSFNVGEEIFTTIKTNGNAFSGHYTAMLFGRKKASSDVASKKIAFQLWDRMHDHPVKNFYLWTILGREKDIKIDTSVEKEVGTRVVMTTEHPVTLLLCWFSQKISYILCSTKLWDCKFNINSEFDSSKYKRLLDKEANYDFVLEADWTYYDSNIDTNFLTVAGLIICAGFPDDRLHRNIRYLITSSIVTKYVAIPPGIVVELNRAQPSGHPFGTLVNCIVNMVYWSIIGYKIYGDDYVNMMDIEVYGDDTRAYFKNHKNLINIDRYVSECGLKSEPLLGNFRAVNENSKDRHQIDFLKRRFTDQGIKWNHKKMFDKFLYPSKNRDINDQYLMVSSWFDSVPTDIDAETIRIMFGKYLLEKHPSKLSHSTVNLIYNNNHRSSEQNYRAVTQFTFDSYNYKFNSDLERNVSVFKDTLYYRGTDYTTSNDELSIYNDNSSILSLMQIYPELEYTVDGFNCLALGRDPPANLVNSNVLNMFSKLIDINIKILDSLVNLAIKRISKI